jgi:hypothetical protein
MWHVGPQNFSSLCEFAKDKNSEEEHSQQGKVQGIEVFLIAYLTHLIRLIFDQRFELPIVPQPAGKHLDGVAFIFEGHFDLLEIIQCHNRRK